MRDGTTARAKETQLGISRRPGAPSLVLLVWGNLFKGGGFFYQWQMLPSLGRALALLLSTLALLIPGAAFSPLVQPCLEVAVP